MRYTWESITSLNGLSSSEVSVSLFESRLCDSLLAVLPGTDVSQCSVERVDEISNQVTAHVRVLDPVLARMQIDELICVLGLFVPPLEVLPSCLTMPPSLASTTLLSTSPSTTTVLVVVNEAQEDDTTEADSNVIIGTMIGAILLLIVVALFWMIRQQNRKTQTIPTLSPAALSSGQVSPAGSVYSSKATDDDFVFTIDRLMNGLAVPIHRATWLSNAADLTTESTTENPGFIG